MERFLQSKKAHQSLRGRLILLIFVAITPFLCMTIYLIISLLNYSRSYDEIVSNMTIANSYNLDFKENIDEASYKLVVGAVTYDSIERDEQLMNPFEQIKELKEEFTRLRRITVDKESRLWISSILRNLDTLEERELDIQKNLKEGGHYDENILMLDGDIYILTELIQDDLQHYIYYQAKNIETLKTELSAKVQSFLTAFIVILFGAVVIVLVVTGQLASGITMPIRELEDVTGQIAKGDFKVQAPSASTREIQALSTSVNEMALNLKDYVERIKEDEGKLRRGELRLLQEQINPHFLYNTLDTIVWLIEDNMTKEAEKMVVSLSDVFRLTLNNGKNFYTIADEERHIRSYLEIQQVRYQDILEYELEIDEAIHSCSIMKLTLQPLVENALYHGIKYKRAKGKIKVSGGKKENVVVLRVEDNGVGMEKDELEELKREILRPCQETEKGFGIANVNERIRMFYGPEYGIDIESEKGIGTRVTVTIPDCREGGTASEGKK